MYILYIPSSCHLNIIGISGHLFACLQLGFGEAQFKNENEEAKEMLAFTTITGRSRFWFYSNGLEISSSPMSVTVHELMFLMSLCQEFYSRLLTSSLVRGQFLTRVYTVPVQTGCYICNEGKEELGEYILLFKNTQGRDGTVWKKMWKNWGVCNLTIRHLPWRNLRAAVLSQQGFCSGGMWQCLRWFLIVILECVWGVLLASSGQMVEMLLNNLQYTGQNPSPQQIMYPVQNVSSAAVEKSGIRGLKKSSGLTPSSYF